MKLFQTLSFAILISLRTLGQDPYEKLHDSLENKYERFLQAVLSNDTLTAVDILDNSVTTLPVQKRIFPTKNIPEHSFKINIAALKDSIINFFKIENDADDNKFLKSIFYFYSDKRKMPVSFVAETNKDSIFSKKYFSDQGTSDDIFLTPFGDAWNSKFYFSKNYPLKYTTEFAVKLSRVSSNLTQIKVVALNPQVINGMGIGVHGPMNEYEKVQPTTIEEYSILLFIADKLGDKTLLPLKLPGK